MLDIGSPGTFDDNGVNLGDLIVVGNQIRMYYVGYQIVSRVKFLAFSGLAISDDNGETFRRYTETPVMDRVVRVVIYVVFTLVESLTGGGFGIWYSVGDSWTSIEGKPYPDYHTRYIESKDGISCPQEGSFVLGPDGEEYRLGRARRVNIKGKELLYFTRGDINGSYFLGVAERNGDVWEKKSSAGIDLGVNSWDDRHLCYPAIINIDNKVYMFYNGNDMGNDGFGVAILEE